MSEPSQDDQEPTKGSSDEGQPVAEQEHGGLTVEDDPTGTQNPADLAGTANSEDAQVGPESHQ